MRLVNFLYISTSLPPPYFNLGEEATNYEMCTGFGKLLGRGQPAHIRDFRLPMEHSSIRDWQDAAEKLTTAESQSPAAF